MNSGTAASERSRKKAKEKLEAVRSRMRAEGRDSDGRMFLSMLCAKCGTVQEVRVSNAAIYTSDVRKSWVCPYCRHGICRPQDAARERAARSPKARKPSPAKGPRPKSGEQVLIECMLKGWCTREFLRDETGLSENSIKMYVNGYLERVRHKPYHVEEKGGRFRLVTMEVGDGV